VEEELLAKCFIFQLREYFEKEIFSVEAKIDNSFGQKLRWITNDDQRKSTAIYYQIRSDNKKCQVLCSL